MAFFYTWDILENGSRAEEEGFFSFIIGSTNDARLFLAREILKTPGIAMVCIMGGNFSLITTNEKNDTTLRRLDIQA